MRLFPRQARRRHGGLGVVCGLGFGGAAGCGRVHRRLPLPLSLSLSLSLPLSLPLSRPLSRPLSGLRGSEGRPVWPRRRPRLNTGYKRSLRLRRRRGGLWLKAGSDFQRRGGHGSGRCGGGPLATMLELVEAADEAGHWVAHEGEGVVVGLGGGEGAGQGERWWGGEGAGQGLGRLTHSAHLQGRGTRELDVSGRGASRRANPLHSTAPPQHTLAASPGPPVVDTPGRSLGRPSQRPTATSVMPFLVALA